VDVADLAQKGLVALAGVVGGGVGGWFMSAAKHGGRIAALERGLTAAQELVAKLVSAERLQHVETLLQRDIGELKAGVVELEKSLDHVSDSSHDLASAAALAAYITENNKRWEQVIRVIGRIEGTLEAQGRLPRRPGRQEEG